MSQFHSFSGPSEKRNLRSGGNVLDFLEDRRGPYPPVAHPSHTELDDPLRMNERRAERREDILALNRRDRLGFDFPRSHSDPRVALDYLVDPLDYKKKASAVQQEDYPDLLVKFKSLQSEVEDLRSRLELKDSSAWELKSQLDVYKENTARQASLIKSLREHVRGTEDTDGHLPAHNREHRELTNKVEDLKERVKVHLSEREDAEQRAAILEKKLSDITAKLAALLKMNVKGLENPLDALTQRVSELCNEHLQQEAKIASLLQTIANQEREFKASRETIMKLVSEVSQEQKASVAMTQEIQALRRERDEAVLTKSAASRENRLLRDKLVENQKVWDTSLQDHLHSEKHKKELEDTLQTHVYEAKAAHSLHKAFLSQLATLLSNGFISVPENEEAIKERVREICTAEKSWRQREEDNGKKIIKLNRQLEQQCELYHETMSRAQKAEQKLNEQNDSVCQLEGLLSSKEMLHEGFYTEKQKHLNFINQLRKKLKVDDDISEEPLHTQYEVLLSRAEQVGGLDSEVYTDYKTLILNLQRKVSSQKEKLDNKKAEIENLQKKIKQLEGLKESQSLMMKDKKEKSEVIQKLEKKIEKLQDQLSEAKYSNQALKSKLSEVKNLEVKTLEKNKTIEELQRALAATEKIKDKAAQKVVTMKAELDHRDSEDKEEKERAHFMIEAMTNELRTVKRALEEVAKREKKLVDFRELVLHLLGFDINTMSVPDHEVISQMKILLKARGNLSNKSDGVLTSPFYNFKADYGEKLSDKVKVQHVAAEKRSGKANRSTKW
ncbi:coiled-coil domain-containing protein 170-like [Polypterus senegalus]|uniref:coiled-coil domain-containing protein 170-like n=1 Tax=Polypterus senegalus TaxID=55291 RepID=UPI001962A04E|nr:coiled-coil domain-containing protein 170-like [Polypterus senegalus]